MLAPMPAYPQRTYARIALRAGALTFRRAPKKYQAPQAQPPIADDRFGATCPAICINIASSFAGSTLSATIKLRISGSDNALVEGQLLS